MTSKALARSRKLVLLFSAAAFAVAPVTGAWAQTDAAPAATTAAPSGAPAAPAAPAKPIDPDTVVVKINDQPIIERDVQVAMKELSSSFAGMTDAQKREAVINLLIDVKLVAQAAEQKKLDQTDDFKREMAFLHDKALMQAYLDGVGKDSLTDAAVKKVYDETIKDMKPEQEVRARHILVETEDEAKKVKERLDKGEDFAKVAKEVSKDPGSAQSGGDLGFFTKDQMVPEFADVAFALKKGETSAPVKTKFGWHIIQVEDTRENPVPTLDQVRDQIEVYLTRRAQQDEIQKLRKAAEIDRPDAPADAKAPAKPE
jgi:peptidyl-prolyl cis-trans isomerase C